MIEFIVTAFYLMGIVAAIEAVMTARTAQGAVAWAISLVFMPFIAVPAYLVLGRSKFEGVMKAYEQSKGEIDQVASKFHQNMQAWAVAEKDGASVYKAVHELSGMALTHSNLATLLINGNATFDSILEGVAQAQDYVLFQF